MGLTNIDGQTVAKGLLPDSSSDYVEMLPIRDIGEVLIFGDVSLLPSRIQIEQPTLQPRSAIVEFGDECPKELVNIELSKAIESLRKQFKGICTLGRGNTMKMIGIRASTKEIRYAILEKNEEGQISFINQTGEHCLRFPSTIEEVGEKLLWVKCEFERIFRQNPDINTTIIKTNEFTGNENNAKRETAYMDAIFLLICSELGIPAYKRLYSQIGTTSSKSKENAEHRVGKTDKYWNTTIADAINCVFWEIRRA